MQNYCLPKANTIQFLIQSETLQRGQWTMATKFAKIQVVSSDLFNYLKKSKRHFSDPDFLNITGKEEYCSIVVFWKAVGGGWVGD